MTSLEEAQHTVQALARQLARLHGELFAAAKTYCSRRQQRYQNEVNQLRAEAQAKQERDEFEQKRKNQRALLRANDAVRSLLEDAPNAYLRVAEYVCIGSWQVATCKSVPCLIPLLGHGSIAIDVQSDVERNAKTAELIRSIEVEACSRTFLPQLEIDSFDPRLRNREAPLSALDTLVQNGLVRYIQNSSELDGLIDKLIARLRNSAGKLISSYSSIVAYQNEIGRPVEPFYLVVLHDYPCGVSEAQHQRLVALAQEAPRSGISLLFALGSSRDYPSWFKSAEFVKAVPTLSVHGDGSASWAALPMVGITLAEFSEEQASTEIERIRAEGESCSVPAVPFDDFLPEKFWGMTSEDGLMLPIGLSGSSLCEVPIGSSKEQLHNILITGAVGQGKSNVLKAVVYGLAARYSPDEVALYLLDYKEGITLYPMARTAEAPSYLPHAKVLGLEADRDFGIEVLTELLRELSRRAEIMKPFGDNLLKYRQKNPDGTLPRIVLVIDEFQLLLDGDRGSEASSLLEQLVRRGRSYGIHVILASQSIGGIASLVGKADQVFSQFPVRIGLKNSPAEARATFGINNDAAAYLRLPGQAVVNCSYGAVAENRIVQTPLVDDRSVEVLLADLCERDAGKHGEPYVFDGTRSPSFKDDLSNLHSQRRLDRSVMLGRSPSLRAPYVVVRLDDVAGDNIALIGRGKPLDAFDPSETGDLVFGTMAAIARSLTFGGMGEKPTFDIVDLRARTQGASGQFMLQREILSVDSAANINILDALPSWCLDANPSPGDEQRSSDLRYLFVLGMDRLGSSDFRTQSFMADAIRSAPIHRRTHCIFWWENPALFNAQLGASGSSAFNVSLAFFGANAWVKQAFGYGASWEGEERRALYMHAAESGKARRILPYSWPLDASMQTEAVQSL